MNQRNGPSPVEVVIGLAILVAVFVVTWRLIGKPITHPMEWW